MSLRTHFSVKQPFSLTMVAACGRGRRLSDRVSSVDCLNCKNQDSYILAVDEAASAAHAAFLAQTPRTIVPQFGAVNADGVMECHNCHGILWREKPRSLFSYHYVCEGCGTSVHPMTETGMCT